MRAQTWGSRASALGLGLSAALYPVLLTGNVAVRWLAAAAAAGIVAAVSWPRFIPHAPPLAAAGAVYAIALLSGPVGFDALAPVYAAGWYLAAEMLDLNAALASGAETERALGRARALASVATAAAGGVVGAAALAAGLAIGHRGWLVVAAAICAAAALVWPLTHVERVLGEG